MHALNTNLTCKYPPPHQPQSTTMPSSPAAYLQTSKQYTHHRHTKNKAIIAQRRTTNARVLAPH